MKIEILFDEDRIPLSIHLKPYTVLNFNTPTKTIIISDLILYVPSNPIENKGKILKNTQSFLGNINNFYATVKANTKEQLAERS